MDSISDGLVEEEMMKMYKTTTTEEIQSEHGVSSVVPKEIPERTLCWTAEGELGLPGGQKDRNINSIVMGIISN